MSENPTQQEQSETPQADAGELAESEMETVAGGGPVEDYVSAVVLAYLYS